MGQWAIDLEQVVKRFGAITAVDGLSLQVASGICLGFLGPNGAGKTTTLEMIEGLQRPTSGKIRVLGLEWHRDADQLRSRIGLALQETHFEPRLTVLETVQLFRSFYRRGFDPLATLERVRLTAQAGQRVHGLSGGQRQRLALAVGLVSAPEIVFLDEPTTGLDPQARRDLWEIIEDLKRRGTTIVLTTHYMDEVEQLSDRIVVVDRGRIIADGTAAALRTQHGGEPVIEVSTEHPVVAGMFQGLPGVSWVVAEGNQLTLGAEDVQAALAATTAVANSAGHQLRRLVVKTPSLDDVFINLTGRSLHQTRRRAEDRGGQRPTERAAG